MFQQFIAKWCLDNNTTNAELLRKAGIEPTYITQLKIGVRNTNPGIRNVYKLCKAMDITMEYFCEQTILKDK